MTTPPAGGPATVNGILYQMLWSLLRALKMHVRECDRSATDNTVERAVLVLEPREGGGDVQERSGVRRIVEQLKAKAGGGTWSLTEVVRDVLPDLYLARDAAYPETEYRMVTEGRMGGWGDVYRFFQGLKARAGAGAGLGLMGRLDSARPLNFKGGTPKAGRTAPPFWPLPQYTERSLFERIVEVVRDRQARKGQKVADREPVEQTREGVWELLANFTFVPDQTTDVIQRQVDSLLLATVARDVDLREKRDALLAGLARTATQGGAQIEADQFLRGYSLDSTPLTAWVPLRERAAACLDGDLHRGGYDPSVDVRAGSAAALVSRWQSAPILVVSAESGTGKSWLLYALARQTVADHALVVLIEATGDGDQDCQRTADTFWKRIKGNDNGLSLDRIAARRRELIHPRAEAWLTLFIDGVRSSQEARQLAKQPWEEWNVRVACACLPEVARTLKAEARDRAVVHDLSDFTQDELRQYLAQRLEGPWGSIPPDVRSTLVRPLLARLYCDIAPAGGWSPSTEYELFSRCWGRLLEGEQGDNKMDTVPLHRLALAVLHGGKYPWTAAQLNAAGLDSEALARLCRIGWLQPVPPRHHQVWHDRLLNWAVAEAICEQYEAGLMDLPTMCDRLRRLFFAPAEGVARPLGYVPMDVVWLLSDPARNETEAVEAIFEALEAAP